MKAMRDDTEALDRDDADLRGSIAFNIATEPHRSLGYSANTYIEDEYPPEVMGAQAVRDELGGCNGACDQGRLPCDCDRVMVPRWLAASVCAFAVCSTVLLMVFGAFG